MAQIRYIIMKVKAFILSFVLLLACISCNNEPIVEPDPLESFVEIDKLMAELADKPQVFTVSSDKKAKVIGKKGTIIHMDPDRLETIDGSPLGDRIAIELLELTKPSDLILQNAPTMSNGEILVTGGSYYLNMTSDGKQLQMKQGKGLDVELPRISDREMDLFLGERDPMGQVNWVPTKETFKAKKIPDAKAPEAPVSVSIEIVDTIETELIVYTEDAGNDFSNLMSFIQREEVDDAPKEVKKGSVSRAEYQKYLKAKAAYEKQQKEIAYKRRTYELMKINTFGWVNCDFFYKNKGPKTDIQLMVQNDSISSARMYAVFVNENVVMDENYWPQAKKTVFRNIPLGKKMKIIALSAKGETPYMFETVVTAKEGQTVAVNLKPSTQRRIKTALQQLR